uniref:Uncharacterized protein n=1 Tax=Heterorhabditis bacteriophora TaxID=37862 RepID=A0A1I7WH44_HETBA
MCRLTAKMPNNKSSINYCQSTQVWSYGGSTENSTNYSIIGRNISTLLKNLVIVNANNIIF